MARTSVYAKRAGILIALMHIWGCDAMMAQQIVAVGPSLGAARPALQDEPTPRTTTAARGPVECPLGSSCASGGARALSSLLATPTDTPRPDAPRIVNQMAHANMSDSSDKIAHIPSDPPPIVVHVAALYGRVTVRTDNRLTIEPLVVTSSKLPAVGSKATLLVSAETKERAHAWLNLAEVKVATSVSYGNSFDVDFVAHDDKIDADELALHALTHGSHVRLDWKWY
ncbi:MAG: hypothetical protein IPM54_15640 [Polyangiaceae bacterium]|nr:hypothetical protein [Polyangiaceae bacterium]